MSLLPDRERSDAGHLISKRYHRRKQYIQQKNNGGNQMVVDYSPQNDDDGNVKSSKPYKNSNHGSFFLYPTMNRSMAAVRGLNKPPSGRQRQSDDHDADPNTRIIGVQPKGSSPYTLIDSMEYKHEDDDNHRLDRDPRTRPFSHYGRESHPVRESGHGRCSEGVSLSLLAQQSSSSSMNRRSFVPDTTIPSPPRARRLATIESAHGRLPKSTRPSHGPSVQPLFYYERIGDPCLRAFRVKLPHHLLHGGQCMDEIIGHAETYARDLPGRWRTDLYSLTKCDLSCREIPGMMDIVKPIYDYICQSIQTLYGSSKVFVDKNQPHILKYSASDGHTGVELHHDRCDVTANLVLSKSDSYTGGGTLIAETGRIVKLEQGEFLLHPGSLVHGGVDITHGTRYLLVTFAHLK